MNAIKIAVIFAIFVALISAINYLGFSANTLEKRVTQLEERIEQLESAATLINEDIRISELEARTPIRAVIDGGNVCISGMIATPPFGAQPMDGVICGEVDTFIDTPFDDPNNKILDEFN